MVQHKKYKIGDVLYHESNIQPHYLEGDGKLENQIWWTKAETKYLNNLYIYLIVDIIKKDFITKYYLSFYHNGKHYAAFATNLNWVIRMEK